MSTRNLLSIPAIIFLTATCLTADAPSTTEPGQVPPEDVTISSDVSSSAPPAVPTQSTSDFVEPTLPATQMARSAPAVQPASYSMAYNTPFDNLTYNILVIPGLNAQPQDVTAIVEDLAIMRRIIDSKIRSLGQTSRDTRPFVFAPASDYLGVTDAVYLDNFGVLFTLKIDFPLLPPPEQQTKPEQPKGDEVWLQARQQMLEPPSPKPGTPTKIKPYEPAKVDRFKTTLVSTLKHSSNIRGLKPDDCVTLVVKAPQTTSLAQREQAYPMTSQRSIVVGSSQQQVLASYDTLLLGDGGSSPLTILTIRAKKSDIDDYANGKLDDKTFGQKCQLITY